MGFLGVLVGFVMSFGLDVSFGGCFEKTHTPLPYGDVFGVFIAPTSERGWRSNLRGDQPSNPSP